MIAANKKASATETSKTKFTRRSAKMAPKSSVNGPSHAARINKKNHEELKEEIAIIKERTNTITFDAPSPTAPGTPDPNRRHFFKERQSIMVNTADIDQTVHRLERFQNNRSAGDGNFRPSRRLKLELGEVLARCLHDVAQLRPRDPIEYMAHWLYKYIDAELYFYQKIIFNQECMLLVLELQRRQTKKKNLLQQINIKMKELKLLILNSKVAEAKLIASRVNDAIRYKSTSRDEGGEGVGEGVYEGAPTAGHVDMEMFNDIAKGCDELIEATPMSSSDEEDEAWLEGGSSVGVGVGGLDGAGGAQKIAWGDVSVASEDPELEKDTEPKKQLRSKKLKSKKSHGAKSYAYDGSGRPIKVAIGIKGQVNSFDDLHKPKAVKREKDTSLRSTTDSSSASYDGRRHTIRKAPVDKFTQELIEKKDRKKSALNNYKLAWGKDGGKLTLIKNAWDDSEESEDEIILRKVALSKPTKAPISHERKQSHRKQSHAQTKQFFFKPPEDDLHEKQVQSLTKIASVRDEIQELVSAKKEKQAAAKNARQSRPKSAPEPQSKPIHTKIVYDLKKYSVISSAPTAPVAKKVKKKRSESPGIITSSSSTSPDVSTHEGTEKGIEPGKDIEPGKGTGIGKGTGFGKGTGVGKRPVSGKSTGSGKVTRQISTSKSDPPNKIGALSKDDVKTDQAGKEQKSIELSASKEKSDEDMSDSSNESLSSRESAKIRKKKATKPISRSVKPGKKQTVYRDDSPTKTTAQSNEKGKHFEFSTKEGKHDDITITIDEKTDNEKLFSPTNESIPEKSDDVNEELFSSTIDESIPEKDDKNVRKKKKQKSSSEDSTTDKNKTLSQRPAQDSTSKREFHEDANVQDYGQQSKRHKNKKETSARTTPNSQGSRRVSHTLGQKSGASIPPERSPQIPSTSGLKTKDHVMGTFSNADQHDSSQSTKYDAHDMTKDNVRTDEKDKEMKVTSFDNVAHVIKESSRPVTPNKPYDPNDSTPLYKGPGPNLTGFGFMGAKNLVTKTSGISLPHTPVQAKISQIGVAMATDMMTSAVASLLNLSDVNEQQKAMDMKGQRKIINKVTDRFDNNAKTGKALDYGSRRDSILSSELNKDWNIEEDIEELNDKMRRVKLMRKGHLERKESLIKMQNETLRKVKSCVSDLTNIGKRIKQKKASLARLKSTLSKMNQVKPTSSKQIIKTDDNEGEDSESVSQAVHKVDSKRIREIENEIIALEHERDQKLKRMYKMADQLQHEYDARKKELEKLASEIRLETEDVRKCMGEHEAELSEKSLKRTGNLLKELDDYVMRQKKRSSTPGLSKSDYLIKGDDIIRVSGSIYSSQDTDVMSIFKDLKKKKIPNALGKDGMKTRADDETSAETSAASDSTRKRKKVKKRSNELIALRGALSFDDGTQGDNETENYFLVRALAKVENKSVKQVEKDMKKERDAILGAAVRTVAPVTDPHDVPSWRDVLADKRAGGKSPSTLKAAGSKDHLLTKAVSSEVLLSAILSGEASSDEIEELGAFLSPPEIVVQWFLLPDHCRLVCAHSLLGRLGAHRPNRFSRAMNPFHWEETNQSDHVFYHHDLYANPMEPKRNISEERATPRPPQSKHHLKRQSIRSLKGVSPRASL